MRILMYQPTLVEVATDDLDQEVRDAIAAYGVFSDEGVLLFLESSNRRTTLSGICPNAAIKIALRKIENKKRCV